MILTAFGAFAQHSLFFDEHNAFAKGLMHSDDPNDHAKFVLDVPLRNRTITLAATPLLGGVVAPLGMALAVGECVVAPFMVLACLPFALCSETDCQGLCIGAKSCVVGPVMLVAYTGMLIFGQTIGWFFSFVEGMPLDVLLHGRPEQAEA